jgi:ribonuclease P protein component
MVLSKETAARFGVSVSSSVVKKAVSRNKIRRKVYDAAGKLLPRFAAGAIAFLNVKRDISSVPADELVRSLEKTLSASGILLGNKTLEVADTPR